MPESTLRGRVKGNSFQAELRNHMYCRPERAIDLQGMKGSTTGRTGRTPPSVQQLDDPLPPVIWLLLLFLV
jgi:hypothetical protein